MIEFQKIRWKNFLSTGDYFTEVSLNNSPTTLIVGDNGAGKSTILDALTFSLFGKSFRKINKPQLVNSVNSKDCVIEIDFKIGKTDYQIRRGIKPNIFEIYINGKMLDQDAKIRDSQVYLEETILKLNYKSFTQIVILGMSFIPFMQLPAWSRRSVIEDLLDINIFSKMNTLLKERNSKIKEELTEINHSLDLYKAKMDTQSKYIKDLQAINKDMIAAKENSIEAYEEDVKTLVTESGVLGKNLDALTELENQTYEGLSQKVSDIKSEDKVFRSKIKDLVSQAKFFEENEICPTCDQDIDSKIKDNRLNDIKATAANIQEGMKELSNDNALTSKQLLKCQNSMKELVAKQRHINSNNDKINLMQKEIEKIQKEISHLLQSSGDIKSAKDELASLRDGKDSITEKKLEYVEERTYNEVIGEMLKDTGIKTKVIKQYLPVMNRLINQYLQVLDFFVAFHLDESFNETIRSRHRDAFNYASFSEGEKQRIDLSLLFTWRQIAKMKNSASTNLLVLDETFDSSLDHDGIDNLTKILNTLEDGTNVFIISHKGDILENKFRSKIEFIKERNFSKIK